MQTTDLLEWLKANGVTQAEFEAKSGVSQSVVSRICNGEDTTPETMRKIYNATGGAVTPNWLVLRKAA